MVIAVIILSALAAALTFSLVRSLAKLSQAQAENQMLARQAQQAEQAQAQAKELEIKAASMQTKLEEQDKAMAKQIETIEELEKKFKSIFESLSSEVLRKNSTQFLELAKENLSNYQNLAKEDLEKRHIKFDELVKPIKETLGNVDKKIGEVEKERQSAFRVLDDQIKQLRASEESLKKETHNLVNALRRPGVRGRWGELQLRKVVEMAGMVKYCDFKEQSQSESFRPDMIVSLPNCRNIIVDAKAPLEAYLSSLEAADEAARERLLTEHAKHVHNHLKTLGTKAYWQQFENSPEFVVMFLPGEMFFSAALEKMPELIERGIENKVILATPTTLIALLQAVAYGWRQEQLAQSARDISNLGKELYERLSTMSDHFASVGKSIDSAAKAYNKTIGSLESRVLVTARKFENLGIGDEGKLKQIDGVSTNPKSLAGESQ